MAGIYIHVPFCKQACHYCNFHFSTSRGLRDAVIRAIGREIEIKQDFFPSGTAISTVYFGGGTPSLLDPSEISTLLEAIDAHFTTADNMEITLEANPDDLDRPKIEALLSAGINRLSVGIQSFHDDLLNYMNRAHDSAEARRCMYEIFRAGFEDVSADLIFGIPGLDNTMWKADLETLGSYPVDHLSCYALTVEPGTALQHFIDRKGWPAPDDAMAAEQFLIADAVLAAAGFDHYEISNYARNGRYARHNSAYWTGRSYLGLGPSAHSFREGERQWNVANNARYVKAVESGAAFSETECLTEADRHNEFIMVSLRTKQGLDLGALKSTFGAERLQQLTVELGSLDPAHYTLIDDRLRLTAEGWLLSDGICAQFFI